MKRREIEDERPLSRIEKYVQEEREFARSPEGRLTVRLRCLDRHHQHYIAELRKLEEFLRQHPKWSYPEVWEALPEAARRVLARRARRRAQQARPRPSQPRLVVNNDKRRGVRHQHLSDGPATQS